MLTEDRIIYRAQKAKEEKARAKAKTRYNGWANWETWNVALWLGNDEGLYNAARAEVRQMGKSRVNAGAAQDIVRELLPNGTPDMEDARAYRSVRWGEIAACLKEL